MGTCPSCTRELDDGLLYLDAHEKPVMEQSKAAWKSCPRCSQVEGIHVYLPKGEFGSPVKQRRTPQNPAGLQSDCTFHRNNDNRDIARPAVTQKRCDGVPASRGPTAPVVRRGRVTDVRPPDLPTDVTLSLEQLDALVQVQVDKLDLDEEGRKVLRTHLEAERSPGNRQAFLQSRIAMGALTCDACGVDLAKRYGSEYGEVVELHHLRPLAHGLQKPKGTADFALLCPTCHRVVHYRRVEPLRIAEVRRLVASST